jgi:hypothetical protein
MGVAASLLALAWLGWYLANAASRTGEPSPTTVANSDMLLTKFDVTVFQTEITQAMGLYAGSEILQPSIFSDAGPLTDRLPVNDMILVRTLYDARITPGMARADALAVAAEIIPQLVEAVRARGVEALYQP